MKILIATLLLLNTFALDKAIYDNDDRLNFHELTDPKHIEWAHATAAMIASYVIYEDDNNQSRIKGKMLSQQGVCEYEKFARELTAADCSGFLISPDTLVTAGHCIRKNSDCEGWRWVFDYQTGPDYKIGKTLRVSNDNIYRCQQILARELSDDTDYAIIKLDRPVLGRKPLKIRKEGHVTKADQLTLIGFPSGLPLKVAPNAKVMYPNISQTFFLASTDSFAGNSGSPVINSQTGEVEGILVRGEEDYVRRKKGCLVPNVCTTQDHCEGEAVTKISEILPHL
ncbi:serine protease [Bacteriovorax sp. Seq25_V]|uniref:trypsin-like serine peptidase n=1 Tax=Bacteriovorax sp. Seq25_V TaxID=1201288 RepID=UPI00038A48AE|nr:serine protease [Bacteriovorax sp. Seq25_V]EQC47111.1 trypsin [Bacteriovorax sp. Seq25_V]